MNIREFNMKTLLRDATVLIVGRRRSGKSWLLRDIMYNHRSIPSGLIFSGTEAVSPFFADFIPDSFIYKEFRPDVIESIMKRQECKIDKDKSNGKSVDGKTPQNNKFIILDDLQNDSQDWKRDKILKSVFFNGRHYNFLFLLSLQYLKGITPDLRSNIDYVFMFFESSIKNKKNLYEDFAAIIPSFKEFCNIMKECTGNNNCLVIKTNGKTIEDSVFRYKARERLNFRVGHESIWKFHNSKFDTDRRRGTVKSSSKSKEKMEGRRDPNRLKVKVSKTGEIIGHNMIFDM